jgi:hypothetical protein
MARVLVGALNHAVVLPTSEAKNYNLIKISVSVLIPLSTGSREFYSSRGGKSETDSTDARLRLENCSEVEVKDTQLHTIIDPSR